MKDQILINNSEISKDSRTYIIAEMSGNHNMSIERAREIIRAAKFAGADAVKLQTYTADTITLDCDKEEFMTQKGGLWEGQTLYELYTKAYTPWEWHAELFAYAKEIGIDLFSSPFDVTAVDFLEKLGAPAYKIASFEINDIPLIRRVAQTKKPILISTGIATLADIELAVQTCKDAGNENVILMKCVSAYPAPYEGMNLNVLPNMMQTFNCVSGLSDHSIGVEIAIAAVSLGARVVEKHFTIDRNSGGVDEAFSMIPEEFKRMVDAIRNVEKALGSASYELSEKQIESRTGSRSLYVAKDIKKGEVFTCENVKSVRPGYGMHTKHFEEILGKVARCDLTKGTPMSWEYIG